MSANQLTLWYLVASVCFILALKGLSHPETARRGNWFGIAGMTIAVLTTIAVVARGRVDLILIAMLAGGSLGALVAADASALYARNLLNFLNLLVDPKTGELKLNREDEIIAGSLVCINGEVVKKA